MIERLSELINHKGLQKVFTNTMWLSAQRVIRSIVGLFVGVWVARYLGPTEYGILNYALACIVICGALTTLGLDSIVVRELVKNNYNREEVLSTAFLLKFIAGILVFTATVYAITVLLPHTGIVKLIIIIIAAGFIFKSFEVIDFYFQSQVQSKYTVYCITGSFLAVSAGKIILILLHASLIVFAWLFLAETVLFSVFLVWAYRKEQKKKIDWKPSLNIAYSLLKDSWPLVFSGLFVVIYMRIDQIMLGHMIGNTAVGKFSAAVRISEACYFIPVALTSSVYPSIIKLKSRDKTLYMKRVQRIYDILMWASILIAVIVSFFSYDIIHALYGAKYFGAGPILAVHIWAAVFIFLGVGTYHYLLTENMTKIVFYRTGLGAISNVALNLILIPLYGGIGAAVATVISYGIAVLSIGLFKQSRNNVRLIVNTLNIARLRNIFK
ncbi:MAG: flippase [Candidatus Ancaeobacter aquaticus]|nr:flippase [Candidatus Ancaeobacter aquaticus]